MSFILDALKKAESERNRRIAPVLMDARIAPPRRGLPGWALALGAILLVNLGVVAWLLLKTPASAPETSASTETAAASATAPVVPTPPAEVTAAPVAPVAAITDPPLLPDVPSTDADPDSLPSLQDLRFAGVALPELLLNLHVYDPAPAHRSVLLNGQRMREGEYTANGVKLESITPTGVVLEAAGRRFRLEAGG
jgi:general secretion pathway protein B